MSDYVALPRARLVEWARLLEQIGEDPRLPQNTRDVLLENSGSIAYFAQAKAHECPMPTPAPLGSYNDRRFDCPECGMKWVFSKRMVGRRMTGEWLRLPR